MKMHEDDYKSGHTTESVQKLQQREGFIEGVSVETRVELRFGEKEKTTW